MELEFFTLEAKTYIHKIVSDKNFTLLQQSHRLFEIYCFLTDNMAIVDAKLSLFGRLLNAEFLEK